MTAYALMMVEFPVRQGSQRGVAGRSRRDPPASGSICRRKMEEPIIRKFNDTPTGPIVSPGAIVGIAVAGRVDATLPIPASRARDPVGVRRLRRPRYSARVERELDCRNQAGPAFRAAGVGHQSGSAGRSCSRTSPPRSARSPACLDERSIRLKGRMENVAEFRESRRVPIANGILTRLGESRRRQGLPPREPRNPRVVQPYRSGRHRHQEDEGLQHDRCRGAHSCFASTS